MNALLRIGIVLACFTGVAGCAVSPGSPSAYVASMRKTTIGAERANAVTIGKSTKEEVAATLGETLSIRFDNGYEVWAYRLRSSRAAELVILFAPNGVASKIRIRSPQPPS